MKRIVATVTGGTLIDVGAIVAKQPAVPVPVTVPTSPVGPAPPPYARARFTWTDFQDAKLEIGVLEGGQRKVYLYSLATEQFYPQ